MSKRGRKNNEEFPAFRAEITYKRMKKGESTGSVQTWSTLQCNGCLQMLRDGIKNMLVLEC